MVDILATESPRDGYISVDPIASSGIVINRNVSNVDVLGPEAGNSLISNGSPANVEGLVIRHAPIATKSAVIWRPAVRRPESGIVAISTIELPIIARAGTTSALETA